MSLYFVIYGRKKMKVKALNTYEKNRIEDKELKRIIKEGEIFDVNEERYSILTGKNEYGLIFVEKIEDKPKVEKAKKNIKSEKAIKNDL